jgi:hypothetical protein
MDRGFGVVPRLSKDLLAVIVTSVFLVWVVATFFGPMLLHIYIGENGWSTLFELDLLVAAGCILGYIVIGGRLPAQMRVQTRRFRHG